MNVLSPAPAVINRTKSECYIVIGNHRSYYGIGEIVYTLKAYFSGRYKTRVTERIVPGQINVIIDEFANPQLVDYLLECRRQDARTRFILMATEFVTPISIFGRRYGHTFNLFNLWESRRELLGLLAHRVNLKARPPYLHARYLGFVRALAVADLVLCAHPSITEAMHGAGAADAMPAVPKLTIYPEISADRLRDDRRLTQFPAGFLMTGTLTKYRQRVVRKLLKTFRKAGIDYPIYQHVPFDRSAGLRIDGQRTDFGYGDDSDTDMQMPDKPSSGQKYLYNLNPPQRPGWPYSSPMRILRAALLGQIPVITEQFGDHDIEGIALVWDNKVQTAERIWVDATMGRRELVKRYLEAVTDYSLVARRKNQAIDRVLECIE